MPEIFTHGVLSGGGPRNPFLYDIMVEHGLTPDGCWDAADIRSYDGSSQDFFDITSNNYDYFRGATSGAAADDPPFTGTAGDGKEDTYFGFIPNDYFEAQTQSNPGNPPLGAYLGDNEAATVLMVVRIPTLSAQCCPYAAYSTTVNTPRLAIYIDAAEKVVVGKYRSFLTLDNYTSAAAVPTSAAAFIAVAWQDDITTMTIVINDTTEDIAIQAASLGNETYRNFMGTDAGNWMPTNSRLMCIGMVLGSKVATGTLTSIKSALKGRRFSSMA